ncbi:activating signal cointegrator 1 complex subunit 3 [Striga asiatica]|uniref:Activating signal cointegrator 1 complex subunit 3 n=1 Tax=Striga asiatica TaxID=4170 RepID=A0A5A7RFE2_STRAF|nr:activating signal cointegrator 1 complex subunit 3 [Striga asiatica]
MPPEQRRESYKIPENWTSSSSIAAKTVHGFQPLDYRTPDASPNIEDDSSFRHWKSDLGDSDDDDGYLFGLARGHDEVASGEEGLDNGVEKSESGREKMVRVVMAAERRGRAAMSWRVRDMAEYPELARVSAVSMMERVELQRRHMKGLYMYVGFKRKFLVIWQFFMSIHSVISTVASRRVRRLIYQVINKVESTQSMIRIVGLSATLPNYLEVAQFLRVNPETGLFFFDSSNRPVPLEQQYIGISEHNFLARNDLMNDICYNKVVDSLRQGHQVMVFVHSRKDTGKTADKQ